MLKEIYTAALGMLPQQTRLEMTANNIANANSTGFKRSGVFEQSLIEARQNMLGEKGEAEQSDPPLDQYTDFTPGALQKTENPLNISIENEGFFLLQDADGNESLTRGGHFALDENGIVVTGNGKALQSDKGNIVIEGAKNDGSLGNDQKAVTIRIANNGEVYANDQFVARIQVMKVDNPQTLVRSNGMEFTPDDKTDYAAMNPGESRIKQGYLETSNVNIIAEMITMIQLQRSFELGQKVITTNDGTLEKSIDIGRYTG